MEKSLEQRRNAFNSFIKDHLASNRSLFITRERFDAVVDNIKRPGIKVDPQFKHWVKLRRFQLITSHELGIIDSLVVPNESDIKGAVQFKKVVATDEMFDVVLRVHQHEMDHAGSRKCYEYVSFLLLFITLV